MRGLVLAAALIAALVLWWPVPAPVGFRLGVTTSVEGSGLADHVMQVWEASGGAPAHKVVAGSGQMFAIAARRDVDVILTHDRAGEAALFASGAIQDPVAVMQNHFILVGPEADPAAARGLDMPAAFARVAGAGAVFISRGDDSGTHRAELRLWEDVGANPGGAWYRATGSGAVASLRLAAEQGAYMLVDEASFARFAASNHGGHGLVHLADGPINVYSVSVVQGAPAAASRFVRWLAGPEGKAAINTFAIGGFTVFRTE